MMRVCSVCLSAALLIGCDSDDKPKDHCPFAAITTSVLAPTVDTATSDLTVYGSVQIEPAGQVDISVDNVQLGVAAEIMPFSVMPTLPPPTVVAQADAAEFSTWHATVPYAVLKDALKTLPGQVVIVATPSFNCPMDAPRANAAIGVSTPFTVDRPPSP